LHPGFSPTGKNCTSFAGAGFSKLKFENLNIKIHTYKLKGKYFFKLVITKLKFEKTAL
jgi:hypothetical protein